MLYTPLTIDSFIYLALNPFELFLFEIIKLLRDEHVYSHLLFSMTIGCQCVPLLLGVVFLFRLVNNFMPLSALSFSGERGTLAICWSRL